MKQIKRVTIIGLGLLGGSLAMAIKRAGLPVTLVGTSRRAATVKKALKRRLIDEGVLDHKAAVKGADLVFVCTPINRIVPTIREISSALKNGAIVTDVGSTKATIVSGAEKILKGRAFFIGGHPMAGTERTGLDAALPDLFVSRPYILTPTGNTNKRALGELEAFIKELKVKTIKFSPETQDKLVAGISHLPLVVATALVNAIASQKDNKKFASVASSGFRDTTRVASGDPELGVDIFLTNKNAVGSMISSFKKSLSTLEAKIRKGNKKEIRKLLSGAKKFRDRIYPK